MRKNFGPTQQTQKKKNVWTHKIPTIKHFGPTKYPRQKVWDPRNHPREKILDSQNTHVKHFWAHNILAKKNLDHKIPTRMNFRPTKYLRQKKKKLDPHYTQEKTFLIHTIPKRKTFRPTKYPRENFRTNKDTMARCLDGTRLTNDDATKPKEFSTLFFYLS